MGSSNNAPAMANVVFPESYPYSVPSNLPNNSFIVMDTNSPETATLPPTPTVGMSYRFKDGVGLSSSNPVTIEGNGNTIDGSETYTIAFSWGFVGVLFNGLQWNVSNN